MWVRVALGFAFAANGRKAGCDRSILKAGRTAGLGRYDRGGGAEQGGTCRRFFGFAFSSSSAFDRFASVTVMKMRLTDRMSYSLITASKTSPRLHRMRAVWHVILVICHCIYSAIYKP